LPGIWVDDRSEETRTAYELIGCYWHGHICMQFRDIATLCGGDTFLRDTRRPWPSLERVAGAGYMIKVQWECEFELLTEITMIGSLRGVCF
jgi:G:T-mismatch repair DNA endonuclease (very short patch repair protein)